MTGEEGRGEKARIKSPLSGSLPVSRGERVVVAIPVEVREKFRYVKPLGEITVGRAAAPILGQSGSSAPPCWTLDVLNIVRRLVESRRRGDESLNKKPTGQPESLRLLTSSPT